MEQYAIPRVSQVQNTCLLVANSDAIRAVLWCLSATITNPIDQNDTSRSASACLAERMLERYTQNVFHKQNPLRLLIISDDTPKC